jgi:hypothetical protein
MGLGSVLLQAFSAIEEVDHSSSSCEVSLRTRSAVWPWAWLVLEGVATVAWLVAIGRTGRHTLSMAVRLVVRETIVR